MSTPPVGLLTDDRSVAECASASLLFLFVFFFNSNKIKQENGKKNTKTIVFFSFFFSDFDIFRTRSASRWRRRVIEMDRKNKKERRKKSSILRFSSRRAPWRGVSHRRPKPKWRLIIERNKKKRTRKEPNGDERVSPLVEFNVDHLLSLSLSLSLGDREVPKSRARPRQPRILSKSFPNRRKPVNTRSNPVKPSTTQWN